MTGLVDDGDFSLFFSLSTTRLLKKNKKKSRFFCYFPHAQAASRSDFEEQSNGECVVDFFFAFFFFGQPISFVELLSSLMTRWASFFFKINSMIELFFNAIFCFRYPLHSRGFSKWFSEGISATVSLTLKRRHPESSGVGLFFS